MGKVSFDRRALRRAIGDAAREGVREKTGDIEERAMAMGDAFRTGYYHRDHRSPAVGGTAPYYAGDVEDHGGWPIGIVYTGNYAAMVDNARSNTLLKARG